MSATTDDGVPKTQEEWLARISRAQQSMLTPENVAARRAKLARMQRSAQSARRASTLARKASRMERTSTLAAMSWEQNSLKMSPAPRAAAASACRARSAMLTVREESAAQMGRLQASLAATTPAAVADARGGDEGDDAAELELETTADEMLDTLECSMRAERAALVADGALDDAGGALGDAGGAGTGAGGTLDAADAARVARLLDELRVEPADADELAAKWALFEDYSKTVEAVRSALASLWDEGRTVLEGAAAGGAAARSVAREIARLDAREAMGLDDGAFAAGADVWFVHPMTKQAACNNAACAGALASLRSKLERLARDDADAECPCCLEPLARGRAGATTLPCCHKVCDECWAQWRAVRGAGAFCPLCRNDEFVDFVLQATPAGAAAGAPPVPSPRRAPLGGMRRVFGRGP